MSSTRWVPAAGLVASAMALVLVPVVSGPATAEPAVDQIQQPISDAIPATPAQPPAQPAPIPTVEPVPESKTFVPVQLQVPRLDVSAPIDPTGVAPDGQAEIPEDASRVGWYRFGAAPGDDGATVIVGHVDSRKYGKGALFPLREARSGDEVLMTVEDGQVMKYEVVRVTKYDKVGLPTEELFTKTGSPVLNIITCGGPYVPSLGGYQQNVVVTAVPVVT